MIFHISQNPYYAEKNHMSLSNTVLSLPMAAITTKNFFDENETAPEETRRAGCRAGVTGLTEVSA